MVLHEAELVELATPTGPMRVHLLRPAAAGCYPGLVLYSEIFQITAPVRRLAAFIASHGYTVACPEVYHEYEAPGTVLNYDQEGSDRGNALKYTKPVTAHDADARVTLDYLAARPDSNGALGTMGICLGGHLAFRAAFDPRVRAAVCFYATDLHKASLGTGDDSLTRARDIQGELLMAWGRQDPHVPLEGRMSILEQLNSANVTLQWHEVNGAHAFLRDEGLRYDAELAHDLYSIVLSLLHRRLCVGLPQAERC